VKSGENKLSINDKKASVKKDAKKNSKLKRKELLISILANLVWVG